MKDQQVGRRSRREFLRGLTAAGAAGLLIVRSAPLAAEPPPEIGRVRLSKIRGICIAPQYVAESLLRAEGFTDVQYVFSEAGTAQARALASGEVDINVNFAAPLVVSLDAGPSTESGFWSCSASSQSWWRARGEFTMPTSLSPWGGSTICRHTMPPISGWRCTSVSRSRRKTQRSGEPPGRQVSRYL